MKLRNLIAVAALLAAPAYAADNFAVKDANATTITKSSEQQPDGSQADKNIMLCGVTTSAPTYTNGTNGKLNCDTSGQLRVTGAGGGGGGDATAANQVTGNASLATIATQTDLKKTTSKVLASPQVGVCATAGTNGCKETRVQLSDNTAAVICPATANVYAVVLYNTVADLGISLSGSTGLTSRVVNSTSLTTSPSYNISTAGVWQPLPVGFTGAISAYGAAQWVTCLQFIEQ